MIYLSWAALYEGATDQAYFDLLVPRLMEDVVLTSGIREATVPLAPALRLKRAAVHVVAAEACKARDAFHLVFIHADTGGRNIAASLDQRSSAYCEAMNSLCDWSLVRCVPISPDHETEAWILADPLAVTAALGYRGSPVEIGLPANAMDAERLADPKDVLRTAVGRVRGRRAPLDLKHIYPAIAQRQGLHHLRQANSFVLFESRLKDALGDLGCI